MVRSEYAFLLFGSYSHLESVTAGKQQLEQQLDLRQLVIGQQHAMSQAPIQSLQFPVVQLEGQRVTAEGKQEQLHHRTQIVKIVFMMRRQCNCTSERDIWVVRWPDEKNSGRLMKVTVFLL